MKSGRIFDIKEFAVYDGAGIRVTYFLQGCPLRCEWCHNPEGQAMEGGKVRTSGKVIREILEYASLWQDCEGGVTFSGGEPLFQPEFLAECLDLLQRAGIHTCLDTAGAGLGEYEAILSRTDLLL